MEVSYFFPERRLNNIVSKKYIIKSEWKCNYDVLSQRPTGFPLSFTYANAIHFSQFFTVLRRMSLSAKVCNLVVIICSLFVGIDCITDKSKVEWKLHFLEWKTCPFVLSFVPDPLPPRKRGLTVPCWYSQLPYSKLLVTSIFFETRMLCPNFSI